VPAGDRSRFTVLLTIEGAYAATSGGIGAWCDSLIRGLPEFDFLVWSLSSAGDRRTSPRRPAKREVEREFVPRLQAFLEATIDPDGPGERLAAVLLDLREHFRRFDPAASWRSAGAWEVVRDHLLVRTPAAGSQDVGLDGPRPDGWSADELPSIGEAVDALAWLGRMLAPLAEEIPRVDLVHATSAGFSVLPGIVARVERGTPLLVTEHAIAPRDLYLSLHRIGAPFHLKRFEADVAGAVARTAYRVADRIVPASRHLMRWELAYGAPRTSIEVVDTGLDDEAFRPLSIHRSERPTVVQVSRIEPEQGQDTLLRVAELVRREIPRVLFLHFGEVVDRRYWDAIRRLHHELELEETVRFAGPPRDVAAALGLGDVAVVTSRSEPFPFSVVQASMSGVPVVATDVGGVREAMEGAGIAAPPDDPAALAEAIAATLRVSPEQRDRVGQSARNHAVTRFGLRRMLDDYRRLYASMGPAVAGREAPSDPEVSASDQAVRIPDSDVIEAAPPAVEAGPTGPNTESPRHRLAPEGVEIIVPGPGPDDRIQIIVEAPRALPPAVVGAEAPAVDLRERLADPDPGVRVEALSRLDDPAAAEFAGAALDDDVPQVRREAVRAICRLNGPDAGKRLSDTVSFDPSPEVRREAVAALAALLSRPSDE
jgi:glycosyltransferase involved in cell wall biosynthesis